MSDTPLDRAQARIDDGDAARLRFFDRLAEAELVLLLTAEPAGDEIVPEVFEVDGARYVLAFDLEERLAAFAETTVPYVALSGRALAGLLAGQGIGLGLNLDVAPSSMLLPAEAMDWLADTLRAGPSVVEARPNAVAAPSGVPDALLSALDAKLALAGGRARLAYLATARYDATPDGAPDTPLLAFIDARPDAEEALARAVAEALTFSGLDAGALDVAFFAARDPMAARLARVGLRIDLPAPEPPNAPAPPGSDPDRPPRLR